MKPWKPRHWLVFFKRIRWGIRWAWSGSLECDACEHEVPCYLSPYVWNEEEQQHELPNRWT